MLCGGGGGVFSQMSRNKSGERGEDGLQECYVSFKGGGGYSKILRGVTAGRRGVNFVGKKAFCYF